jgi:hypothetical protein
LSIYGIVNRLTQTLGKRLVGRELTLI